MTTAPPVRPVGGNDMAIGANQVRARSHEVGVVFANLGLAVEEKVHVITGQPAVKR